MSSEQKHELEHNSPAPIRIINNCESGSSALTTDGAYDR
jgi:hypothetical protein